MIPIDKIKHFAVGFLVAMVASTAYYHIFFPSPKLTICLVGAMASAVAGVIKEAHDPFIDPWDIVATVLGAIPQIVLILLYF